MRNCLQGQGRRPAISGINRRNTLSILSPARRDESDVPPMAGRKIAILGQPPRWGANGTAGLHSSLV